MSSECIPSVPSPEDEAALVEQLVAYLDHELDEPASRRIEQLLAENPKLREILRGLDQSWQALEVLPRAEVQEAFTHTTLEMVAVAASNEWDDLQCQNKRRQRTWRAVGLGAALAAGCAGFWLVAWLRPDPNEQLLRHLPVIENFDQYRHIGDIEFLRLLEQEGLFLEEDNDGA